MMSKGIGYMLAALSLIINALIIHQPMIQLMLISRRFISVQVATYNVLMQSKNNAVVIVQFMKKILTKDPLNRIVANNFSIINFIEVFSFIINQRNIKSSVKFMFI